MSEKKSSSILRTRNFSTVVYPESAPANWKDILSDLHIPCFISPLHDKDINPTNEPKKPHYHVMLMYEGPKTKEQASEVFKLIGGVGCEVVNSARAMSRYFCHLDNPEKAQYSTDDIIQLGGADYYTLIGTMADKAKAIREMSQWVDDNDIISFYDLFMYASVSRSDWFDALINSSSYIMKELIKSRAWKLHNVDEK